MDRQSYNIRREQWRQIVISCNNRNSNVSKAQWCKDNSINQKSFYYWQRQFRNELLVSSSPVTAASVQQETPVFVDVTNILNASPSPLVPALMIDTGDYRVYISSAVQEHTLSAVLKALKNV